MRDRQHPSGLSQEEYLGAGFALPDVNKVLSDNVLAERTAEAGMILASQDIGFAVEQPFLGRKT